MNDNSNNQIITGEIKVELTQTQVLTAIKQGFENAFKKLYVKCGRCAGINTKFKQVMQSYLDKLKNENPDFPVYKVKKTKLPRKLKKAYKKAGRFDFDIIESVKEISMTIEV